MTVTAFVLCFCRAYSSLALSDCLLTLCQLLLLGSNQLLAPIYIRLTAILRARDLLWRINANIAGVVVNDVDMRLENFYTYRYGMYGYRYGYGYPYAQPYSTTPDEPEDEEKGK